MTVIKTGMVNALEALAEARKALDALPQGTVVVIQKAYWEGKTPTYTVFGTLGTMLDGKIVEA